MRIPFPSIACFAAAAVAVVLSGCHLAPPEAAVEDLRILVSPMDASAHCASKAYRVDAGLDLNGNGWLDLDEATHTLSLCDPSATASSAPLLARIDGDSASPDCASGGFRVLAGRDYDGDGRLADAELGSVAHLCQRGVTLAPAARRAEGPQAVTAMPLVGVRGGAAAARGRATRETLVRVDEDDTPLPCPGRASRTASGIDLNRNGRLEPAEVEVLHVACGSGSGPRAAGLARVVLPAEARVGATLLASGGAAGWRIGQAGGQRINTERLQGPWGGGWAVGGPAGRWSAIAVSTDGRRIIVAGDRGLLVSTDGGASWQPLAAAPVVRLWHSVALSRDGRTIVASSPETGLHASSDGGQTWSQRAVGPGWGRLVASADLQRLVAVRDARELWISADAGRSWRRATPKADWTSLAASDDGRVIAATATGSALQLSEDGGHTWRASPEAVDATAVTVSGNGRRIVVAARRAPGALLASDDGGRTWSTLHLPRPAGGGWSALASAASGRTLVAASTDGGLWTSTDGATTWQFERTPHRVTALAINPEGLARLALTDGGPILRAASATTPGPAGGLSVAAGQAVGLRHVGMGIWSLQTAGGSFHVQ